MLFLKSQFCKIHDFRTKSLKDLKVIYFMGKSSFYFHFKVAVLQNLIFCDFEKCFCVIRDFHDKEMQVYNKNLGLSTKVTIFQNS